MTKKEMAFGLAALILLVVVVILGAKLASRQTGSPAASENQAGTSTSNGTNATGTAPAGSSRPNPRGSRAPAKPYIASGIAPSFAGNSANLPTLSYFIPHIAQYENRVVIYNSKNVSAGNTVCFYKLNEKQNCALWTTVKIGADGQPYFTLTPALCNGSCTIPVGSYWAYVRNGDGASSITDFAVVGR